MKTVGVVLATYNGERFLKEQMDSILDQTRRPDRIVVVDDGSGDGTRNIVRGFAERFPGLFTFTENEVNLGSKRTFEIGMGACQTDYIALSDQDDIWEPGKIETQFRALKEHPGAMLCFHDLSLIDHRGAPIGANFWEAAPGHEPLPVTGAAARARVAALSNPVPGCTMFFSSALKKHLLPVPPSKWVGHDWWISAVAFFLADPLCVQEPLARYRRHARQTAGIGMILKKTRSEREKISVALKVKRELQRIFKGRSSRRDKLIAKTERTTEMSEALLKIINLRQQFGPPRGEKMELDRIKEGIKARLDRIHQVSSPQTIRPR